MDKARISHIVSEILVLISMIFYINQKNKVLINHIESLTQEMNDQKEIIDRHEKIILQLVANVKKQKSLSAPPPPSRPPQPSQPPSSSSLSSS